MFKMPFILKQILTAVVKNHMTTYSILYFIFYQCIRISWLDILFADHGQCRAHFSWGGASVHSNNCTNGATPETWYILNLKAKHFQLTTRYYILTTSPGYCCWCCTGPYNCTGTTESVRSTCIKAHLLDFCPQGCSTKDGWWLEDRRRSEAHAETSV